MIRINGYPIDAALTERLRYESVISENPVEKGADLTDHIRPKRPVLEIDGIVSDTPIGLVALDPSRKIEAGKPLPSADAFQRFVDIHNAAQTVVVECSFGKFESMALEDLSPEKDAKSKKAFKFTATFRQIEIQENTRTASRTASPNGGHSISLGSLESTMKFLKKNVLWVRSIASTDADGLDGLAIGPDAKFHSLHKPKVHKIYGAPVLSTDHVGRIGTNGYDRYGHVWVDHYKVSTGDTDDDNTALSADGYVLLHDTPAEGMMGSLKRGASINPGVKPGVKRGYYFLNGTTGGTHSGALENANPSSKPDPVEQNPSDGTVTDGSKRSLTQRPPSLAAWDHFLRNNQ